MPSDKEVAMTGADSRPLKNASQERAFPLSMPQLGLWAAQHMQPGSSACVTAQYSQILGAIDVPVFERASRLVIGETEALRLCFGEAAGTLQWVQPPRAAADRSPPRICFSLDAAATRRQALRLELPGSSPDHGRLLAQSGMAPT